MGKLFAPRGMTTTYEVASLYIEESQSQVGESLCSVIPSSQYLTEFRTSGKVQVLYVGEPMYIKNEPSSLLHVLSEIHSLPNHAFH